MIENACRRNELISKVRRVSVYADKGLCMIVSNNLAPIHKSSLNFLKIIIRILGEIGAEWKYTRITEENNTVSFRS